MFIRLTQKRLAVLLVLLVLLPFVARCFYSHPGADDCSNAVQRRELGFWVMQHDFYLHFTGRLFPFVILTEVSPLVLRLLDVYWLMPLLTLSLLFSSLHALLTLLMGACWVRVTTPAGRCYYTGAMAAAKPQCGRIGVLIQWAGSVHGSHGGAGFLGGRAGALLAGRLAPVLGPSGWVWACYWARPCCGRTK